MKKLRVINVNNDNFDNALALLENSDLTFFLLYNKNSKIGLHLKDKLDNIGLTELNKINFVFAVEQYAVDFKDYCSNARGINLTLVKDGQIIIENIFFNLINENDPCKKQSVGEMFSNMIDNIKNGNFEDAYDTLTSDKLKLEDKLKIIEEKLLPFIQKELKDKV